MFKIANFDKKEWIKNTSLLVLTIICASIATISALLGPFLVGRAVDAIPDNGNIGSHFFEVCVLLITTYIISVLFAYLYTLLSYILSQNLSCNLRKLVFDKISSVPIKTIDNTPFGRIISYMLNDIENTAEGIFQLLTTLVPGIITVFGTITIILSLNTTIGFAIIALTPLSLVLTLFVTRKSKKYFKIQQHNLSRLNSLVTESYSNQKMIIAYDYQNSIQDRYQVVNQDLFQSYKKSMFMSSINNPASRVVNYIVYSVTGLMGILLKVSTGDITSLLLYCNHFNKPFTEITSVTTQLQTASASLTRVKEFLEATDMQEKPTLTSFENIKGNFEFKNVTFSYNQAPFLENFNLSVPSGKRVAIVGPTGSGKTTLINLIMRFYELNSGSITIDGTDITDISKCDLRRQIGMVLQDSYLFRGTIADNIAYGQKVSIEEIEAAATKAHCHSFIETLPDGYHTMLENNADIFSEGQKQLLCIARIMLKLPPILILDEATSNIDTRTERLIQSAFAEMMQGRTTFVIAHRLSTIIDADIILVIIKGNVVELGTHAQLLAKNGFYTLLYNSQYVV